MDEADRAEQLEQWSREMALANARQSADQRLTGRTHCKDCGYEIEAVRQQMGGVVRCAECHGYYQQEQHLKGY